MAILTITLPSGTVYDYDTATTGMAGKRQDLRAIQSFNILVNDAADEWTLYVNHQIFIGRYATQAQAIGALFGCFIHSGADKVGFAAALENQIDSGMSVIAEDGDNITDTVFGNGQFGAKITNFNSSTFEGTVTVGGQFNKMNLGYSGAVSSTFDLTSESGVQQHTIDARYDVTYESSIQAAIPSLNKAVLPDIVVAPLDVNISTNGVPVVGVPFTAETTLTNYDARIPIQYKWEWHEDPNGSNTPVWSETTYTGTSSYTPLTAGVSFRITVTCKYALGTHAGDDVFSSDNPPIRVQNSETTGLTKDRFSWIQGPEITLLSQDEYNISPVLNTDYVGTDATFDYAWTREINGVTASFGTNAATQVLSLEGVYESDVTGQNIINGITYSATEGTRNSITILPAGTLVADIKLFLTADPNGTEQTVIQPTTEYFAYPYDTNGTRLTDPDTTWVFPGQLVAPSNVAFTLSGTEAVGETLTASAVTYDGGASTITYSWNGAGVPNDQSTYLLDEDDEDNTVTLTVTATNNGGTADGTATTGVIDPIAPPGSVLQTLTYTANASGTIASVTSVGVNVLSDHNTANVASGAFGYIRPIYGDYMDTSGYGFYSHTLNGGAVNERIYATSGPAGDTYMQQFSCRIRTVPNGAWANNADVYSAGQPWYNPFTSGTNIGSAWNATLITANAVMEVEVYLAGDRPV